MSKKLSPASMEGFAMASLVLRFNNRKENMLREASEAMDWAMERLQSGELCKRFDGDETCVCASCMFHIAVERINQLESAMADLLVNSEQTFDPDDPEMKVIGVKVDDGHVTSKRFYDAWLVVVELIENRFNKDVTFHKNAKESNPEVKANRPIGK